MNLVIIACAIIVIAAIGFAVWKWCEATSKVEEEYHRWRLNKIKKQWLNKKAGNYYCDPDLSWQRFLDERELATLDREMKKAL